MAQTIAEQAVDTRLLVSLLSKAEIGQTFTYAELSRHLGRKVEGSTSNLLSARKILQRDYGMVFDTIWGQGIKRLSDSEIVALGDKLPGKVRRLAKRTIVKVSVAKDEALTNEQIVQRNAAVSMAGVLMHVSTKSGLAKLEAAVKVNAAELPVGKTLELFKG